MTPEALGAAKFKWHLIACQLADKLASGVADKRLKTLAASFAVLLVVIVAATSVRLAIAAHTVSPRTGPSDLFDLVRPHASAAGSLADRISSGQRINILLLARGGAGDDNPDLTDTVIVASVRPLSHQAAVISLPRDLWVKIPAPAVGDIQGKLYSAYALGAAQGQPLRAQWRTETGAGDLAAATVAQTIGQPVDYWISIDGAAFEVVIDSLGGVRVTVPDTLDDANFPVGDSGQTMHVHFDPGPQVMDGRRAHQYAQSRLSTSETDRSRRQELVLTSLLASLHSANLGVGILQGLGALENGLRTNLRPLEIQELERLVRPLKGSDVKRVTLEDSGLLVRQELGDGEILVPPDGSYDAVRTFIEQALP